MLAVSDGDDILLAAEKYVFILIGGAVTVEGPVVPLKDIVIYVRGGTLLKPVM